MRVCFRFPSEEPVQSVDPAVGQHGERDGRQQVDCQAGHAPFTAPRRGKPTARVHLRVDKYFFSRLFYDGVEGLATCLGLDKLLTLY